VLFDMDGDSDLDLAIITDDAIGDGSGGFRSSLRILRNNGSGTFTDATSTAVPAFTSYGDRNQGVANRGGEPGRRGGRPTSSSSTRPPSARRS
jgi:hypothetical protein